MRCEAISLSDVRCQRTAPASRVEVDHKERYLCHVHRRVLLMWPEKLRLRP